MRTRTSCVAVALLFLVAAAAHAQSVLSEADALDRLSADSPRVRAIRAAVEIVRAESMAAARWPNPRLALNRESVSGVTEHIATVTQALPVTGWRGLEKGAAAALVDAAGFRADEDLRRARAELRAAFAALQSAQTRESRLVTAQDRLGELADRLSKREAAGDAAGYDVLRAQREVAELRGDWGNARADRARAQAALAAFFAVGAEPSTIVAAEPVTGRRNLPALEVLFERAGSTRPDLAALRSEIESARISERAAARRLVPEPEIVAGTKSSNAGRGGVGSVVGIFATISLFDRAQPERSLALARMVAATARVDAFQVSLRAQIAGLRAILLERQNAADSYRNSLTSVDQFQKIAQVSYDAGERGILELLDAYRTGVQSQLRQVALDDAIRQAEIELEFVSGWEMP